MGAVADTVEATVERAALTASGLDPGRNYLLEVQEAVTAYLDSHDHVISAEAADELISEWKGTGTLEGWLNARASSILAEYIYRKSLSRGGRKPRANAHARFRDLSEGIDEAYQAGGAEASREYYRMHSVMQDGQQVRKPLNAMNARQLGEVRDRYRAGARDNAFMGKVLEAVRKRVADAGDGKTVGDIYSPEQLEVMFQRDN